MTSAQKSSPQPAASGPPTGTSDVVLHMMKRDGIPLTRQNYLDMAYPTGLPHPWTAELEAELPQQFQKAL
jgi:hypothetical protein